jgi:hypothetical protein
MSLFEGFNWLRSLESFQITNGLHVAKERKGNLKVGLISRISLNSISERSLNRIL